MLSATPQLFALFDPQNELTEKQLDELGKENFDDFLSYLDQKAEHLKKFTKPLDTYHLKMYAGASSDSADEVDLKKLKKLVIKNSSMWKLKMGHLKQFVEIAVLVIFL